MTLKTLIAAANTASRGKNWPEAVSAWRAVIDASSAKTNPKHLLKYARALRSVRDLEQAESVILQALEQSRANKPVFLEAATIASESGNWHLAAERWDEVVSFSKWKNPLPASTSVILKRSFAHQMLGNLTKSESILLERLARDPQNIALQNALNSVQVMQKRDARGASPLSHIQRAPQINIETICQCFWDAEAEFALLDFKIDGIYVWPLLRMRQYYELTRLVGIYDAAHPNHANQRTSSTIDPLTDLALKRIAQMTITDSRDPTLGARLKRLLGRLKSLFGVSGEVQAAAEPSSALKDTSSQITPNFGKKIAVLMATRKIKGEELYSLALRKELGSNALLLDRAHGLGLAEGALDFDVLVNQFRLGERQHAAEVISDDAGILLEDVREFFQRRLGFDIGDLATESRRALRRYKSIYEGFSAFWKIHPVETLFLTNGYGISIRPAMVAAQDCGIHTVELQHGFISQYHLGYSWPNQDSVPYSPDELWGFGDYWSDVTPLPKNTKPRTIGAPYVTEMAQRGETKRDESLVVFTSQGVVGRHLVDWAIQTAARRPDKKIVFRLHPSEDLESYEELTKNCEPLPENFSFSSRQPVIFQLLAEADIQVGAFSTTLLEGMLLGCRTVVVNLPGIEYMRPVIARGDALFVKAIDELVDHLDDAPQAKDPAYYYASPVSPLL